MSTDGDTGQDLAVVPEAPVLDVHGPYALARLEVARILEGLTGSKLAALEALTRLESALWASALLHQPDAARAREAFGAGLISFRDADL